MYARGNFWYNSRQMKARTPFVAVFAAVFAAAAGCVSIDRCGGERLGELTVNGLPAEPVEHIVVSNFGYYLFDIFPLVAGNAKPDRWLTFAFFSDQVKLSKMHSLLSAEVQKHRDAEVVDLVSTCGADPCFSVSLDPKSLLGLLFCCREVQLSAVVLRPRPEDAAAGADGADAVESDDAAEEIVITDAPAGKGDGK